MALLQNSSSMVFLNQVPTYFGVLIEVLMDHGSEFLGMLEALCAKALICHYTSFRNYPKANYLAKQIIQIIKYSLQKYGLLLNNHCNSDLMLL